MVRSPATATNSGGSRIRGRVFVSLAWMGGAVLAGFLTITWFGGVSGEEFNPHTLARRSFMYFQVPWVNLQVTPVSRQTVSAGFEQVLLNRKLVQPTSKNEWHLVHASISGKLTTQGDSSILLEFLGDDDSEWAQWSLDNPQLATQFWPVVFQVARRNHYLLIPDLMELAAGSSDSQVAEFMPRINRSLVQQYLQAAQIQEGSGNGARAQELVDLASSYAGDDPELQQLIDNDSGGDGPEDAQ